MIKENIDIPVVITKMNLVEKVERLVRLDGLGYTEALIEVCDELDLDYADVGEFIKKTPLKKKIELEAIDLHFIPGERGNELCFK